MTERNFKFTWRVGGLEWGTLIPESELTPAILGATLLAGAAALRRGGADVDAELTEYKGDVP